MYCLFERTANGLVCSLCGATSNIPLRRLCEKGGVPFEELPSEKTLICRHLLERKADIKIPCTCNGATQLTLPTYGCSEKNRCIPQWLPRSKEEWAQEPESRLYTLCLGGCTSFSSQEIP